MPLLCGCVWQTQFDLVLVSCERDSVFACINRLGYFKVYVSVCVCVNIYIYIFKRIIWSTFAWIDGAIPRSHGFDSALVHLLGEPLAFILGRDPHVFEGHCFT